jgi:hypothetical protein
LLDEELLLRFRVVVPASRREGHGALVAMEAFHAVAYRIR